MIMNVKALLELNLFLTKGKSFFVVVLAWVWDCFHSLVSLVSLNWCEVNHRSL